MLKYFAMTAQDHLRKYNRSFHYEYKSYAGKSQIKTSINVSERHAYDLREWTYTTNISVFSTF